MPATNGKKLYDKDGNVQRGPRGPRGGLGPELYQYKLGDRIHVDLFDKGTGGMDGSFYADMWTGKGEFRTGNGLLAQTVAYGGLHTIQEDGAPGHGYANKAAGKPPTEEHTRFMRAARDCSPSIKIHKQSAYSPELNDLDLGAWWALQAAVDRRANEFLQKMKKQELLDKLWEVIKEEWEAMDPAVLHSVAEHKVDVVRSVLAAGGKKLKKEPHAGARKRTRIILIFVT